MLCQIVKGPQFQNFTLKCCFLLFSLAQGLRNLGESEKFLTANTVGKPSPGPFIQKKKIYIATNKHRNNL